MSSRTGELCNRLASDTQVVQNAATVSMKRIKINQLIIDLFMLA